MAEKYELPTYFLKELCLWKTFFLSFWHFLSTWFPAGVVPQFCFWRNIRHIWEKFCFVKFPLLLWNSLLKYLETICTVLHEYTFFRMSFFLIFQFHYFIGKWLMSESMQIELPKVRQIFLKFFRSSRIIIGIIPNSFHGFCDI